MKLNFAQVLRPASGRSRVACVEPCLWSKGRHNYVGGVTAGKASHNASNDRGVTAGKIGPNSSKHNKTRMNTIS